MLIQLLMFHRWLVSGRNKIKSSLKQNRPSNVLSNKATDLRKSMTSHSLQST